MCLLYVTFDVVLYDECWVCGVAMCVCVCVWYSMMSGGCVVLLCVWYSYVDWWVCGVAMQRLASVYNSTRWTYNTTNCWTFPTPLATCPLWLGLVWGVSYVRVIGCVGLTCLLCWVLKTWQRCSTLRRGSTSFNDFWQLVAMEAIISLFNFSCPFGPCLLWPNGWMHQDTTWYGRRPQPRRHCVRWGPSCPPKETQPPPIFGPCLLWQNGCMHQDATWYGGRPRPRRQCVVWRPSSPYPPKKETQQPPSLFGACLLWPKSRPSRLLLSSYWDNGWGQVWLRPRS